MGHEEQIKAPTSMTAQSSVPRRVPVFSIKLPERPSGVAYN